MIFLGLGFLLGPLGLRWVDVGLHSPLLEVVAVISLALVLFMDAVNVDIDELKADWFVPLLTLGPGTLLTIAGVAVAGYWLLGAAPVVAILLGAILASTDPVVLRDVVRDPRIPRSVRRALSVEAGMNDLIVLPIVLVLIAMLTRPAASALDWTIYLGRVLVLSPLLGLLVGGVGGWLMGKADARFGIRTEYQALYGIGLVLAAFATGQTLGGDGFLASFFAGLAITLFNVSLCDCFIEYGEVTAEMLMFLAFVLFGAMLSTLFGIVFWHGRAAAGACAGGGGDLPRAPVEHGVGAAAGEDEQHGPPVYRLVWAARSQFAAAGTARRAGARGRGRMVDGGDRRGRGLLGHRARCHGHPAGRRGMGGALPRPRKHRPRSERRPLPGCLRKTGAHRCGSRRPKSWRCRRRLPPREIPAQSCWTCAPADRTRRTAARFQAASVCSRTR